MENIAEQELAEIYAKVWNSLDAEIIEPYLDERVVYESQVVFTPLVGKEAVLDYLRGKITTIKKILKILMFMPNLDFVAARRVGRLTLYLLKNSGLVF